MRRRQYKGKSDWRVRSLLQIVRKKNELDWRERVMQVFSPSVLKGNDHMSDVTPQETLLFSIRSRKLYNATHTWIEQ